MSAATSALDHCYFADGGFTVVKRASGGPYPGTGVLETLVQGARRCLSRPGLALAAVDEADLRALPQGAVLTLRPAITPTAGGWAVAAGSTALHCRDAEPGLYPASLVLESLAQRCAALLRRERGPRLAPLRVRGVRVLGAVRPGQPLAHETTPLRGCMVSGVTWADGRPVLVVDELELGEAGTTG